MSWRAAATVLIVVFGVVLVQAAIADPLITFETSLNATGDYSNEHFDGNAIIDGLPQAWFNMGLIAIFGLMVYGVMRVIRQELTRGGL